MENKNIDECEKILNSSKQNGLSEAEAERRLIYNGENYIGDNDSKSLVGLFFGQLKDPMIYILILAIIVSLALREFSDAIVISFVIVTNGLIGATQEYKADKSLETLKKISAPNCLVKRNGNLKTIDVRQLVVGDLVVIERGMVVPADLRLVNVKSLKIDESALTGETLPVLKDSAYVCQAKLPLAENINMAYMSTNVVAGSGEGLVVATGIKTEVGKIAGMIKDESKEGTLLQKKLSRLGKYLGLLTLLICGLLFCIALIQGRDVITMLINAISLAVAAIPEGLPAVVTIVLALGVQRMVKSKVIIKKLHVVETLGAVNVVCSDKTGTLTKNKMTVKDVWCNGESGRKVGCNIFGKMMDCFILCNDYYVGNKNEDPTEFALIEYSENSGFNNKLIFDNYKRSNELPFDSNRKMMSVFVKNNSNSLVYTKGAPDYVLEKCSNIYINNTLYKMTDDLKEKVLNAVSKMTRKSLRVISAAYKANDVFSEDNLTFLGFVGMMDPPKEGVKETIETFKNAGIKTVMITGDHKDTAQAIAQELGIAFEEDECITGNEIDGLEKDELKKVVRKAKVFARTTPKHKSLIVKALKENGDVVAMTGDGVNDAPSLKIADVGIAMGEKGTEVAKAAADVVLADDKFTTIESAIEEGRTIYNNIRKSVLFLLSSNFAEIITMFVSVIIGFPVPLIAIHVLWVNLLTDSIPALALGCDLKENGIMNDKPRKSNESLFGDGGLGLTIVYGIIISLLTLLSFISVPVSELNSLSMNINFSNIKEQLMTNEYVLAKAQTFAFSTLAVGELIHALGMRDTKESFIRKNIFKNKLMDVSLLLGLLLQVSVVTFPFFNKTFKTVCLSVYEWSFIFGMVFLILITHEIIVLIKRTKKSKIDCVHEK